MAKFKIGDELKLNNFYKEEYRRIFGKEPKALHPDEQLQRGLYHGLHALPLLLIVPANTEAAEQMTVISPDIKRLFET